MNTVLITRWEPLQRSMSQTSLCRGYGKSFEIACTTQEAQSSKSSSHHRVVSYSLKGMKIVVQFEADACDCRRQNPKVAVYHSEAHSAGRDLTSERKQASSCDFSSRSSSHLNIVDIGEKHDSDCLIEIKSRDHKNRNLDDIMVQMWLSGRRRVYFGRHVRGRFDTDTVYQGDIDADLREWQKQHEDSIACFIELLSQIRRKVKESALEDGGGRFALICERNKTGTVLTLWRREGGQDFLQSETLAKLQR